MKQKNLSKKVLGFGLFRKVTLLVLVAVLGLFVVTANQVFAADFDSNDGLYYSDFTSYEETEETAAIINEEIGDEGFILLKNDGVLPTVDITNVSVFGRNSTNIVLGGGGSGAGDASGAKDIFDSLDAAGYNTNPVLTQFYLDDDSEERNVPGLWGGVEVIGETPIESYSRKVTDSFALFNDAAIVVISRSGSEGGDLAREDIIDNEDATKHYLELGDNELDMLDLVKANFENIIVVINNSSPLELGDLEDDAAINAIVWVGHPGTNAIMALGRILNGEVNPSGRTVDIYTEDFTTDPVYQNFGDNSHLTYDDGGVETDSSTIVYDSTGTASSVVALAYEEGIYMGYRYYETRGEVEGGSWYEDNVVYPFGYGLSYTSFSWAIQSESPASGSVLASGDTISVTVRVTNTGDVAGKEVVQLYYSAPYTSGEIEKSSVVLGGFAKTSLIQPGQHQDVVIELDVQDMASYDYNDANSNGHEGYELDAGAYEIKLMMNSHDEVSSIPYTIAADINYDTDKVTGNTVENRFGADGNYNSLPEADGITMTEMSRADFAGTFPAAPTVADMTIGVNGTVIDEVAHVFVLDDLEDPNATWDIYDEADAIAAGIDQYDPDDIANRTISLMLSDMINVPKDDPQWDTFLNQLTYEELATFVSRGSYSTASIAAVGKDGGVDLDGPASLDEGFFWASECVIAATWNVELAEQQGIIVGNEGLWLGVNGWYGPAMNTHRSPFSGRNFEYYSEDGVLGGKIAAAVVSGAQSKGLYAYIKHFAVNDQETDRMGIVTYANEQVMREIYFKPFQIAVQEGGAYAVMSSFNRIGADAACANYALLVEVLRDEWGFEGHVVTDYFSGSGTSNYMNLNELWVNGNDIPLGNQSYNANYAKWDETVGAPVYTNLSSEVVPSYTQWFAVRQAAKNVLYTSVNSNLMGNFIELGEAGGALDAMSQAIGYEIDLVPEGLEGAKVELAYGNLPEGLSISENGILSGEPAVVGSYSFTVSYTADYWVSIGTANFTLEVNPAFYATGLDALEENVAATGAIVSDSLAVGVVFTTVESFFGLMDVPVSTMTYSIAGGSLPDGLSMDEAGNITGTPTVPGSYDVEINTHLFGSLWGGWITASKDIVTSMTIVVAEGAPLPTFDVTFDANFPDSTPEVIAVLENTPVDAQEAPYRPGAIFLGWFTDMEATTAVDFDANVAADVTYYAGWIDVAQLVDDLDALDGDLATQIAAVNTAIAALQTALEADDADLADDIAAVNTAIAALQTALESADGDLADDVAALQASIDALNDSLDAEGVRIDDIETTLADTGCGSSITLQSSIIFATLLVLTISVAFVITRNKKQYNK